MPHGSHDGVGLVRKETFLGMGAQEADEGKECYD